MAKCCERDFDGDGNCGRHPAPFGSAERHRMADTQHTCHAAGCQVRVPPKMFMCKRHWYMLPKRLRDDVWTHYRPGQEVDKRPSTEYQLTAAWCVCWVADKEGVKDHLHVRSDEAVAAGD